MTFMEFDSFEEAQAFMRAAEAAANAKVTPEQASIGYGDYWFREDYDIPIWGYVNTLDELDVSERALGADDEEIASEREMLADAHERGYRYGKAYSVVVPDGEWGSTHIADMTKIDRAEFDRAKEAGWQKEHTVEINVVVTLQEEGDWQRVTDALEPFPCVSAGTSFDGKRDMQFEVSEQAAEATRHLIHTALENAGVSDEQIEVLEIKEGWWTHQ